jgi:hypothetical protein
MWNNDEWDVHMLDAEFTQFGTLNVLVVAYCCRMCHICVRSHSFMPYFPIQRPSQIC